MCDEQNPNRAVLGELNQILKSRPDKESGITLKIDSGSLGSITVSLEDIVSRVKEQVLSSPEYQNLESVAHRNSKVLIASDMNM